MQLGIAIIIVALAAGYLIHRVYRTAQAAKKGLSPCSLCVEGKSCAGAGELKRKECGLIPIQPFQKN